MRALPVVVLVGCSAATSSTVAPVQSSPQLEVDPVVEILDAGQDLCAYQGTTSSASAPEVPADAVWVHDLPFLECLDGQFMVEASAAGASATALLFEDIEDVGATWVSGVELDPLDGVDDCGLLVVGEQGSDGTGLATLDGGSVRASGSWGSLTMDRTAIGHEASLSEMGFAPAYGEPYDLWITGGTEELPEAVDLPGLVVLPEHLELTSPDLGAPIPRADLVLQWTGTGAAPVGIQLSAEGHLLRCEVTDDGEFMVPGELLAAMPPTATGISLWRETETVVGTQSGRTYLGIGAVSLEALELVLE